MIKRNKLNYDNTDLVENLRESTGKGVDAFFSSPPPPKTLVENGQEVAENLDQQVSVHARTHAPKQAQTDARMHASISTEEKLKKVVLAKKHLSSFTFRFQNMELEKLDEVTERINEGTDQKVSKNDVVRLAVNWLLEDYEEKKEESMLAKVLRHT